MIGRDWVKCQLTVLTSFFIINLTVRAETEGRRGEERRGEVQLGWSVSIERNRIVEDWRRRGRSRSRRCFATRRYRYKSLNLLILLEMCIRSLLDSRWHASDFSLLNGQEKEAKKEAFRKYLESSGVVDSLTKGFLSTSFFSSCIWHFIAFRSVLWITLFVSVLLQFWSRYTNKTTNLPPQLSESIFWI